LYLTIRCKAANKLINKDKIQLAILVPQILANNILPVIRAFYIKGVTVKFIAIIIMTSMMLFGCASSNELPPISQIKPSVAEEGSLANEKLIADATTGLIESANIQADAKILKFVIQRPMGSAGQKAWREMWIVSPESNSMRFIITFKEAGPNAADFEIQKM
jgi:hypothetical protein